MDEHPFGAPVWGLYLRHGGAFKGHRGAVGSRNGVCPGPGRFGARDGQAELGGWATEYRIYPHGVLAGAAGADGAGRGEASRFDGGLGRIASPAHRRQGIFVLDGRTAGYETRYVAGIYRGGLSQPVTGTRVSQFVVQLSPGEEVVYHSQSTSTEPSDTYISAVSRDCVPGGTPWGIQAPSGYVDLHGAPHGSEPGVRGSYSVDGSAAGLTRTGWKSGSHSISFGRSKNCQNTFPTPAQGRAGSTINQTRCQTFGSRSV